MVEMNSWQSWEYSTEGNYMW